MPASSARCSRAVQLFACTWCPPPCPLTPHRPSLSPPSQTRQLPVTLLYDYQSVSAVVEYINGALTASAQAAAESGERATRAGSEGEAGSDVEDITGSVSRRAADAAGPAGAAGDKPSELLKMLRPPQAPRPLFLAAPGVANAQSAYFSFSQFLQASWV